MHPFKFILYTIGALWLALALGSISLDDEELNLLHRKPLIRAAVVFIFSFVIMDIDKYEYILRLLISFAVTILYSLLFELNMINDLLSDLKI
jgi:hypothetical protein